MARRRANSEGSIYKRKDGRWVAQIEIGKKEDGSPDYKYFYRRTQREAKDALQEYSNPLRKKTLRSADIYLDDYILNWLYSRKQGKIKDSSFDRLESTVKNQINPRIGQYKLSELTSTLIQSELINKMVDEGLSHSSVKKAKDGLNNCLEDAAYDDHIMKNPMKKVVMPEEKSFESKEMVIFTEDEISRFEAACISCYNTGNRRFRIGEAYLLILYTGMRMGEALAITWGDVDFDNKLLRTNGNMIMVKDRTKNANKKYIYKHQDTTKAQRRVEDRRVIPLGEKALAALKALEKHSGGASGNYVISTTGKSPSLPNVFLRSYKSVLKIAGIDECGIHSLRHTFASVLFSKGVDIKVVSELLGHANTQITYNKYVHLLKESKHDAVNVFDNL